VIEVKPKSLSEPDAVKAEAYFERALAVARPQRAKSWELRATMSMARLWRDQGKPQQARELLAPVCGWFTEGFDTLDLKEAKALLEESGSQCPAQMLVAGLHRLEAAKAFGEKTIVSFLVDAPKH
jgi:predicted ATPase